MKCGSALFPLYIVCARPDGLTLPAGVCSVRAGRRATPGTARPLRGYRGQILPRRSGYRNFRLQSDSPLPRTGAMTEEPHARANRWKRFSDWDERPLRLDKFAAEDAANGFAAFKSPYDPKPGFSLGNGVVESMDGIDVRDFDMIDVFISRYH